VVVNSPHGHDELIGDLAVLQAGIDQSEHVELASGQTELVLSRSRTWPPGQRSRSPFAEATGDDRRRWSRLKPLQGIEGSPQWFLLV
jgi:hypothetical protein